MDSLHQLVYQLYFNHRKTQREIAEELEIKRHTITTMFKENEWDARPSAPRREEVDSDDVYDLYFQENLSQKEVAEKLGLSSTSPIKRIFKENDWETRGRWDKPLTRRHFSSEEERKGASIERADKRQQELKKMREHLFGTECRICGVSKERTLAIHRKDFTEHRQNKLWIKTELDDINTDEWVSLCVACHRGVHWMHEQHSAEWNDIELHQQCNASEISKEKKWYELSDEQKEVKRNGLGEKETVSELRKRLFGEKCSMCESHNRKLVIHRKDGRPHDRNFLRSRENLEALDTDEWVLLCQKCHRYVHWAEEKLGIDWHDFEKGEYEP